MCILVMTVRHCEGPRRDRRPRKQPELGKRSCRSDRDARRPARTSGRSSTLGRQVVPVVNPTSVAVNDWRDCDWFCHNIGRTVLLGGPRGAAAVGPLQQDGTSRRRAWAQRSRRCVTCHRCAAVWTVQLQRGTPAHSAQTLLDPPREEDANLRALLLCHQFTVSWQRF